MTTNALCVEGQPIVVISLHIQYSIFSIKFIFIKGPRSSCVICNLCENQCSALSTPLESTATPPNLHWVSEKLEKVHHFYEVVITWHFIPYNQNTTVLLLWATIVFTFCNKQRGCSDLTSFAKRQENVILEKRKRKKILLLYTNILYIPFKTSQRTAASTILSYRLMKSFSVRTTRLSTERDEPTNVVYVAQMKPDRDTAYSWVANPRLVDARLIPF